MVILKPDKQRIGPFFRQQHQSSGCAELRMSDGARKKSFLRILNPQPQTIERHASSSIFLIEREIKTHRGAGDDGVGVIPDINEILPNLSLDRGPLAMRKEGKRQR